MKSPLMAGLLLACCLLTGCGTSQARPPEDASSSLIEAQVPAETAAPTEKAEEEDPMITVKIGDQSYPLTLEENDTAEAFRAMLPLSLDMQELNGNEKYIYLNQTLPSSAQSVRQIQAGDLMLFGSSCLVLFYESFSTSYSYTPIGRLDAPDGLAQALGHGNVTVSFDAEG